MKYYPPLSQLIAQEALPSDIGLFGGANETIEVALKRLLKDIRFKDLVINQSAFGDVRFYSLSIVANKISFVIPGTDIAFVFFPADDGAGGPNDGTGDAKIPIAFEWRWGVKRYVADFETAVFSHSPREFFDLLLKVANISESQFIGGIVETFIGDPDPYTKLIQDIRTYVADYKAGTVVLEDAAGEILANADAILAQLATLIADLQDPAPAFDNALDYIAETVENLANTLDIDLDICQLAFETVTRDVADADGKLDSLLALFGSWFSGFSWEDVEELLVPQFSLAITQLPVALEFPRKWLLPLDAQNEPKPEPATSKLTFKAGSVKYSTRNGLTFDGENSFGFEKSAIGKTGLTLQITDAKIDFSRTTNIAEADAAGYPVDFVGVYVKYIEIGLPEKWFAKQAQTGSTTLGIVARDLLVGTGGVTGTIGLEALDISGMPPPVKGPPPQTEMKFVLGKKPEQTSSTPRKGFELGFSSFDMTFRQNTILKTEIKGSVTVPKFQTAPISIDLCITHDGDFEITASVPPPGHDFTIQGVFTYRALKLAVGKDDKRAFLRTTGDLDFSVGILGAYIKKPIHLEKLLIHSDGSIELEGGSVPLPESATIEIGPIKIAITAIHFGKHTQELGGKPRNYAYFGLDGALSMSPGGFDASGDGFKFYYTIDDDPANGLPSHHFFKIDGMGIDLVFPMGASEEEAALLLRGYLSLKKSVYQGSISFGLPKAKIYGGAAMKYDTSYPAWIVDVNLDLPKPLPLGSTDLGIYGFRGLFGLRYIATKDAITQPAPLPPDASWGDYYRAKQPDIGITVDKFLTPDKLDKPKDPFSVGVGVGLCTESDGGKVFSSQLFLLVSLPNLIMLEGRADILSNERVGPTDEPPYYAYLAISPESIELGAGVHYMIPKTSGSVLDLNAVMQAAFFFHNSSAWYVHFGTKDKPITARIISLLDGYAYLALSASGMETGAGVHFDFSKGYGPVSVAAHAYLDMWAYVAFERFQAGGGIALGGYVDIHAFGFGFNIELAAALTVEVPQPFRVAGSVEVCITINLKIKKIHKCCKLEFVWDKDKTVNTLPVPVMTLPADASAAVAVHMVSGSTYAVEFSTNPEPAQATVIPLDCFVDVKFAKPLKPSAAVVGKIGGYTSPPSGEIEIMPPQYGSRVVQHAYALDDVNIQVRLGANNWIDYKPYQALAPEAFVDATMQAQLANLQLGFWQKQEAGYSQIRFLALTPFSWVGAARGYVPEEMGVTAKSTYCVAREREKTCVQWTAPKAYWPNTDYSLSGILYRVEGDRVEALAMTHAGLAPVSLAIGPSGHASFRLLDPAVHCEVNLFTTAPALTIRWQRRKVPAGVDPLGAAVYMPWLPPEFEDVGTPVVVPRAALSSPQIYDDPSQPIERFLIETPVPDLQAIAALQDQLALAGEDWVRTGPSERRAIEAKIAELQKLLQAEHDKTCVVDHAPPPDDLDNEIAALQDQLADVQKQLADKQTTYNSYCIVPAPKPAPASALAAVARPPATNTAAESPPLSEQPGCLGQFFNWLNQLIAAINALLNPPKPVMSADDCAKLAADIAALQKRQDDLNEHIAALVQERRARADAARLPPGWDCGTFVHEICWLSQKDYTFNQAIPGIAAIEADFSHMRAAAEGAIAPIWQPRQIYRIKLSPSDTITDPDGHVTTPAQPDYYIHFRTSGPPGYFTDIPASSAIDTTPGGHDDGRLEVPERAIKFYVDNAKSSPDPSGDLLYAKPVYYHDVKLRLFFDKPHAYHFFARWADIGAGARNYALQLAIKDPAEAGSDPAAAPPLPDYQTALVTAPVLGTQSWVDVPDPQIAAEFDIIRSFQHPLSAGGQSTTACLSTGGAPIVPLSRSLEIAVQDLEPNKLYTAVILNRSEYDNTAAEVGSYPFKTSLYPDFAAHIASLSLKDADGNQRLAVFDFAHAFVPDMATALAAAAAILGRQSTLDTSAYPDPSDRLIYGCLKIAPPAPALSLEVNFMSDAASGATYGAWIRSPEALLDPRLPESQIGDALRLFDDSGERGDKMVLYSKDRCQAFIMVTNSAFPTQNVSLAFKDRYWDGNGYADRSATSATFSKP